MKRSRIVFIILLSSTFLLYLNSGIPNSKANPVWIYPAEFGGFIPKDDHSCSMPNASVLIEISAPNPNIQYDRYELEFTGNYSLYNPNNPLNLTIAAPFSSYVFGENSTCIIKINDSIIPYKVIQYHWNESYSWDEYISIHNRNLIICNITLPMNKTVILEYKFESYLELPRMNIDSLEFHYDVGTAAAWNGTISETVEFKVHGRQPDSYSNNNNPRIIDISDGKRYIWEWRNIVIPIGMHSVYISYKGYYDHYAISLGNYYFVFFLFGIISLIILQRSVKLIKK